MKSKTLRLLLLLGICTIAQKALASPTSLSGAPVDDASGLATEQRSTTLASFYASSATITQAGPSMTDLCTITGSATKTVKVTRVGFGGVQTTAGNINVQLIKRTTQDGGIAVSTLSVTQADSASQAATNFVVLYTTAPTVGTASGVVQTNRVAMLAPATAVANYQPMELFGALSAPIVLRGTAQSLAINLLGVSPAAGANYHCNFSWTEE